MNNNWQKRTELILNTKQIDILRQASLLIVGLGGVGAYAAEMLCRAGVENFTLVDSDIIQESNINRQLIALNSTIGLKKTDVLANRLIDINAKVKLNLINAYMNEASMPSLFENCSSSNTYSYVIDAIDTLSPKVALIQQVISRGIPLVSSMGAGAKFDPSKITSSDISKSCYCPLAHQLRKRLNRLGIKTGFTAVYSTEIPLSTAMQACNEPNKITTVGTISYMPALFGCTCASVVIRNLISNIYITNL